MNTEKEILELDLMETYNVAKEAHKESNTIIYDICMKHIKDLLLKELNYQWSK